VKEDTAPSGKSPPAHTEQHAHGVDLHPAHALDLHKLLDYTGGRGGEEVTCAAAFPEVTGRTFQTPASH
jgi:hypothetical protein